MAQLIVEHAGETRRFRLNPGRLSIGSGEQAVLSLDAPDLAEIHVEIDYGDDGAVLRPKPGVIAPKAGSKDVTKPARLRAGVVVELGSVTFRIEAEEGDPEALAPLAAEPPPASLTPISTTPKSAGSHTGSEQRLTSGRKPKQVGTPRKRTGAPIKKVAERTRPTVDRRPGIPTWVTLLGLAALLAVGAAAMKSFSETASVEGFSVLTSHKRIQEAVDAGNFVVAKDELEKVDRHTNELDADWRAIFEALRVKADQGYAKSQVTVNYGAGTQVLDNKLKLYETSHLNPPSRAKARVFVQRAKDWLDTYPGHPSSGWVEAKMRRYTTVAQPNTPPTFEDVSWEIRMLAGDKVWPRDYKTAFQKLDTYRTMNPDDVNQVDSLAADLRTTRQEVFTERMDLVAGYWEDGSEGKAVETLVQIIVKFDDTDLCNQAADLLVSMEGLVKYVRGEKRRYEIQSSMRGYRNERPEYYEKLKQHPTMASFFAKHKIGVDPE
tara:strand:+ start:12821 stop:14296 length:1476 start_codon:yes stop_codon:yes gene_type:complete